MIRVQAALAGRLPKGANLALFAYRHAPRPLGSILFGSVFNQPYTLAKKDGFEGKNGQFRFVHSQKSRFERFFFLGLGSESEAELASVRKGVGVLVQKVGSLPLSHLFIRLPQLGAADQLAQAATEGALLGSYKFTQFKSQKNAPSYPKTLTLIAKDTNELKKFNAGIRTGQIFAEATRFARDLINYPPSDMSPDTLVKTAKTFTKGPMKVRVFNKSQIEKMKMGAFLGVNRGSAKPPYFLHFVYRPSRGPIKKRIGLCGKGITFDSGGLSLKPPKAMETMKMDMAGAATVLAIFKALKELKPPVEVHGFTPLTENMPGGRAMKPGDVVKAMNGKTIEVLNTDAEGRLVLADALSYASLQKLDQVMDIATLTGACTVALGSSVTGVMGTHPKLIQKLKMAAQQTGEKIWELPLEKDYESHIKSPIADMKNLGLPMQAGTIIGGIFLKHFVKPGLPWVHLDIASTAWTDSPTPLAPPGATGSMVRTLLAHILSYN